MTDSVCEAVCLGAFCFPLCGGSLCSGRVHSRLYLHREDVAGDLRFSETFLFGIHQIHGHVLDMGVCRLQQHSKNCSLLPHKGERREKTNTTKTFSHPL